MAKGLDLADVDSLRWVFLDELAKLYSESDFEKGMQYIDESLVLKRAAGRNEDITKSYWIKGNLFNYLETEDSIDSSIYYYNLALKFTNVEEQRIPILSNIISKSLSIGKLDSIEESLLKVIDFYAVSYTHLTLPTTPYV